MDNRPIGIFDSGLGGLTVFKEVKKVLPEESLIYLGDTARVPYGVRSKDTVIKFALEDLAFLLTKKVKCVIVACNTVSSLALNEVKRASSVPVFGVISPVVKIAIEKTKNQRIGVIGTRATVGAKAYSKGIKKQERTIKVFERHTSLLVPLIEEGLVKGAEIRIFINKYLSPLKKSKIDCLIMGCTHYPIIESELRNFLGNKIYLVNPAKEVAKEVSDYLNEKGMTSKSRKEDRFYLTDLTERFIMTAEMFLGEKISGKALKVIIS